MLGTEYELDLDRRASLALRCGGCRKVSRNLDGVFVYARFPGQQDGFLPIEVFDIPSNETE